MGKVKTGRTQGYDNPHKYELRPDHIIISTGDFGRIVIQIFDGDKVDIRRWFLHGTDNWIPTKAGIWLSIEQVRNEVLPQLQTMIDRHSADRADQTDRQTDKTG